MSTRLHCTRPRGAQSLLGHKISDVLRAHCCRTVREEQEEDTGDIRKD